MVSYLSGCGGGTSGKNDDSAEKCPGFHPANLLIRGDVHAHFATTNVILTFRRVGVFLLDVCSVAKCYLPIYSSVHEQTLLPRLTFGGGGRGLDPEHQNEFLCDATPKYKDKDKDIFLFIIFKHFSLQRVRNFINSLIFSFSIP